MAWVRKICTYVESWPFLVSTGPFISPPLGSSPKAHYPTYFGDLFKFNGQFRHFLRGSLYAEEKHKFPGVRGLKLAPCIQRASTLKSLSEKITPDIARCYLYRPVVPDRHYESLLLQNPVVNMLSRGPNTGDCRRQEFYLRAGRFR